MFKNKIDCFDVAAYILNKMGEMTKVKLLILVYYCQAWSLVWDEKPLFDEVIKKESLGPIVKDLYNLYGGCFIVATCNDGNAEKINNLENQKETIDSVLEYYGDKESRWLVDLSKMENPWKNTQDGHIISDSKIFEYYISLDPDEEFSDD